MVNKVSQYSGLKTSKETANSPSPVKNSITRFESQAVYFVSTFVLAVETPFKGSHNRAAVLQSMSRVLGFGHFVVLRYGTQNAVPDRLTRLKDAWAFVISRNVSASF